MAKATIMGTSTLGVQLSYGIETTAGTKPTNFTLLQRINNIGGIELSTEQIDASALEDSVTKYIKGRADLGGEWSVTVNLTDETIAEWNKAITDSDTAYKSGLMTWFQVSSPYLAESFYVTAQLPSMIPMPEMAQNELQTVDITLTINEYKGMDAKVVPTV